MMEKIWFGQSRNWSTGRQGCLVHPTSGSFARLSSMKSSFQINVTYSAPVRAGGEAATALDPRKE